VHPMDRELTALELNNIIAGNPTYYIENRYITKSGKVKWIAWTTSSASEQGAIYCSGKDITEKKELEELLAKANVLARIGGWEVDIIDRKVYWSNITREIHEVEPGFVPDMDKSVNFYKAGVDRDTILKIIEDAIEHGIPGDAELQIITARGNPRWVRAIVEAEFAEGKCKRIYGSFQDINDRKQAEIASREALEERNIILESIDDAFFAIDNNWKVLYWNKMAEQLFNTPKSDVLDFNLLEVFPNWVGSEAYDKYLQAMKTGHAIEFEHKAVSLAAWLETAIYPSSNGLSAYIKDISERKNAEFRLQELNDNLRKQARELASSNAELEQFAYVASHDLQEPLRMVTSFLTQLEKKYNELLDDKGRQYIYFAVDGAKRMRQIILDLLDFSRVGRMGTEPERVDFSELAREVVALHQRQIQELRASVIFNQLPTVVTYRGPVRQLLQNLVSNSLKYHRRDIAPFVEIAAEEKKDHYVFSVKDNGIGISPEYFEKIFVIFQRLHNKDEYSGTGMGLAIAKKIVEHLGGSIWLESTEGNGTTFYFTLLKDIRHESDQDITH